MDINGLEGIGTTAFYHTRTRSLTMHTSGGASQSIGKAGYAPDYDTSYQGHYLLPGMGKGSRDWTGVGRYGRRHGAAGYAVDQAYLCYDSSVGFITGISTAAACTRDEGPITGFKGVIFQYCQSGFYATTDYHEY